jgi:addiction module HigA family antidote
MVKKFAPVSPGEILRDEFLEPMGITPYRLAKDINVPATRIGDIINKGRAITADTALLLAKYFGTTAEFWVNMQAHYDLLVTEQKRGKEIEKEVSARCA